MKNTKFTIVLLSVVLPFFTMAQGAEPGVQSLHNILEGIYDEMMPLCSDLIGVSRSIAGFAATWYIAHRVWRHIANAEPIDFYPLFRPFVLGFCIMIFPSVLSLLNTVLKPTVTGTAGLVQGSNSAIEELLRQREEALMQTAPWQVYVGEDGKGDRDRWYRYTHGGANPSDEGVLEGIGNSMIFASEKMMYNFKHSVREMLSEILRIIFEAAALCINTLRIFQMIVLSILGPLVFGLAVFDGFQHTLTAWLARYINIFLWLPVANIFGAIIGKLQQQMIKMDIHELNTTGDTALFSPTDTPYMIFMIIGIVGYFTVPSVASYIVQAGGGGALQSKTTGLLNSTASWPLKKLGM